MNTQTPRRIIREAQCKQMTGLDRWTRSRLEKKGRFPRRLRLGLRAVGWFEDEVLDWQNTLARGEEWRDSANR